MAEKPLPSEGEIVQQEATLQEAALQGATLQEAAPREVAPREVAPQAVAPQVVETQETTAKEQQGISFADKLKFGGLIVFLLLLVVVGVLLMPYFANLTTEEGRLALSLMIRDTGVWGVLICVGLQFLQVVVAIIPGQVVQIVVGAIYGPLYGTIMLVFGALFSSLFVFYVVRRLGAPFVHAMISKKHEDKLRFFKESKRLDVIVFVLFLIPGLPNDLFTYLVPLTEMRPANFFILSTLGRFPGIVMSTFIGSAAIQGHYAVAIVVALIAGGLGALGIIFNGKIMKAMDALMLKARRK